MNYTRYLLILVTLALAAYFSIAIYLWSYEFKDRFFYSSDWISYIMVFAFVMFVAGVFKWLLKEEVVLTDPKRRRRKK